MAVHGGSDNMTEREPTGGLTPFRGLVFMLLFTGACELFFIGVNSIMAKLLGH